MDFGKIRDFCKEVCNILPADGADDGGYVRVRASSQRSKGYKNVASGLDFTEMDEQELFQEVRKAIVSNSGTMVYFQVEAVWRGETNPFKTVDFVGETTEIVPPGNAQEAIASAMTFAEKVTLKSMDYAHDKDRIIGEQWAKIAELEAKNMELRVTAEAIQMISEAEGDEAVTLAALDTVKEIMPDVIAAIMASKKAEVKARVNPEDPAASDEEIEKAGNLVDELFKNADKILDKHPSCLTRRRKVEIVKILLKHVKVSEVMGLYQEANASNIPPEKGA